MKKITFLLCVFALQVTISCFAQELPENFEYPWRIEYQGKWVARNTVDTDLTLDIPRNVVLRYCAGNIIPLDLEYVGNRGAVTFEIIPDEKSEEGVRYEIREIQILCD